MRPIKIILCILPLVLLFTLIANGMKKDSVLICYGKLKPENIKGYDYLIVESKQYQPSNVRVFKSQNKNLIAYISLGEVNEHAEHYKHLKGSTLGKNSIWNSYYLDLRSPKTTEVLMGIIDGIFKQGYDGLFLDNIDNFTIYGPQKDQKPELLALLKKIKEKYPDKKFIQNAGIEVLETTAPFIDAMMIESIATSYDFAQKEYKLRDEKQFNEMIAHLKSTNEKYNVPVFLIEYSDSKVLNDQIIKRLDETDFEYFIANIDLQHVPKFKA